MPDNETPKVPKQIRSVCQGAHQFDWVNSDYLYYQKGDRERHWFRGRYGECSNLGCNANSFMGNKMPYFQDMAGDPGPDNVMLTGSPEPKEIENAKATS